MHGRKRKQAMDNYVRQHGWYCYYCHAPLIHEGNIKNVCLYEPEVEDWTHCGCGEHDLAKEPCIKGGSWRVPQNSPYRWFQVEHKIPRARGGTDDVSNLCLSCPDCNSRKGTKTAEEFMAVLS